MRAHQVVLCAVPLISACSLVFNGDEYTFDGGADSAPGDVGGDVVTDVVTDVGMDVGDGGPTRPVRTLLGSARHTCVITADGGELLCWGAMERLGAADLPDPVTNIATVGLGWSRGDIGSNHTCAIDSGGGMFCWGIGDQGQLGYGMTMNRGPPQSTDPPAPWTHVSASREHSCAISDVFAVYCAGSNPGAVQGLMPIDATSVFENVRIGMETLRAGGLTTGANFTCAIADANRQLICWGELGDVGGTGTQTPVALTDTTDFVDGVGDVCAGEAHICATDSATNAVYCWGRNDRGQVGAMGLSIPSPVSITENAVGLTCGAVHTCAIVSNGDEILCWGADDLGQLGIGPADPMPGPNPVFYAGTAGWTDIASGGPSGNTTCAINRDGEVWCWGDNAEGQAHPVDPSVSLPAPLRVVLP